MKTFTTSKGMTVTSELENVAAIDVLKNHPSVGSFGKDLALKAAKWGLSNDQWAWAHKLANEALCPSPKPAGLEVKGISEMFKLAGASLKRPKIRFNWNGTDLQLSMAGPTAKVPGSINVTDGRKYPDNLWHGRIVDGTFQPSHKSTPQVEAFLKAFSANPQQVAAEYGHKTGSCCFCDKTLTDDKNGCSVQWGYGPTCAKRWGLPHGKVAKMVCQVA